MYVYFITAFHEKKLIQVKIGYSRNPENRLSELQVGSALRLRLMGKVKCRSLGHAKQVEKSAHRIFRKQRRRGEWFHLSPDQIQQLRNVIERSAEHEAKLDAESEFKTDPLMAEYRAIVGDVRIR